MAQEPTRFLDLDAVSEAPPLITVKLEGRDHHLVPLSVDDFVQNQRGMQSLGAMTDIEEEIRVVMEMLCRAFPSMTPAMLGKVKLDKMFQLLAFANASNGANKTEEEAMAEANANPPPDTSSPSISDSSSPA